MKNRKKFQTNKKNQFASRNFNTVVSLHCFDENLFQQSGGIILISVSR